MTESFSRAGVFEAVVNIGDLNRVTEFVPDVDGEMVATKVMVRGTHFTSD